jgi:hypothetical protein
MSKKFFFRLMGLILLGAGIYQIIAAGIASFFWIVAGDWRDQVLQIMVVAFWITIPVTYFIWQRLSTRINI